MSKTYDVLAAREDAWWMVSIPEIDGLTQARDREEVEQMAREYIAVTTDVAFSEVAVNVRVLDTDV